MAPDSANEPTPTGNTEIPQTPPAEPPVTNEGSVPVTITPSQSSSPETQQPALDSQSAAAPETTPPAPAQPTFQATTSSVPTEDPAPQNTSSEAQPSITPPNQPGQSVIMGGKAGQPRMPEPTAYDGVKKSRRKLALIVAAVVAVLLLGGGYVFAFYLPNTPANMYKTALSNTNRAYDKLVEYSSTTQAKHYKGYTASGTFKLTSPTGSGDGTFTASSDGDNAQGSVSVDALGEKFNANYRAILASGQTTPDVYLQVTGIKKSLDSFGLNQLDNLDGQWIAIDHTIIETGLANVQGSTAKKTEMPTYADVKDAMIKFGDVNQKYLFTTDSQYAVLKNEQYLGKSTQDGRTVAGYKVGYDKAHLKQYFDAVGAALDSSDLGKWYKQTNNKELSSSLQLDNAKKELDKAKADYTFNMYVDTQTKLIHKVHFADTKDPANNFFEAGLNYVGGSKYPIVLSLHNKDGNTVDNGKLTMTLDSSTNQIDVNLSGSSKSDNTSTFTLNLTAKPTNDTLNVVAPKDAKSVVTVLKSLGLDGLLDNSADGKTEFTF